MAKLTIANVLSTVQILFFTLRKGKKIGKDDFGNIYYEAPARKGLPRTRRWVIYKDKPEASTIPPLWHGWLHHQSNDVPTNQKGSTPKWVKKHQPNLTGTQNAYKPKGHLTKGGKRAKATGDYEAWLP